jgi:hypothetical protein
VFVVAAVLFKTGIFKLSPNFKSLKTIQDVMKKLSEVLFCNTFSANGT